MRFLIVPPRHRAPLLILLALALAYWSKVLFTGQVLLPGAFLRGFAPFGSDAQAPWTILHWDALGQYYPWRAFVARELHAGRLPLWNPHQFCGTPLLANGQSAVFYPLNLPFWILDPATAFGVSAFLHTLLAAFGTYFLAQRWQMSRSASLLAAIAFAFCGYLAAWVMLPTLANTAAWLPLLLVSSSKFQVSSLKDERNLEPGTWNLELSVSLACALLAGHPQIFFFLLLALALHALFARHRGRAIGQLALAGALAGLLCAIQLLPMLELAKLGHRAVGGGPTAEGWAGIALRGLDWPEAAALIFPGWPMRWGSLNENFGYAGLGVVLLALCGVLSIRQLKGGSKSAFALALTLFGLLYAFATPLPQLFYWSVPGLSQMGGVGRSLFLWNLGAALLAGFGLDVLRKKSASLAIPLIALLLVTGELFASGWVLHPIAPRESIYPATKITTFLRQNERDGERTWFITPRGGWLPAEMLQQTQRNHPPGVLPPNGATVYGLNDINGYDSLAPRAYREWLAQFTSKISPELNGNMILLEDLPQSALDAMNVRYVVSLRPRDEIGEKLVLSAENCFVYEREIGPARRVENGDFYPGWKNGKYQPETFRFGAFVSLCAILAVSFQLSAFSNRCKLKADR